MTRAEARRLVADLMRKWPQAAQRLAGDAIIAEYATTLADINPRHAAAAVEAWARDGERWPPTAGQIMKTLARLVLDPPEWGNVKAWLTGQAPVPDGAPELPDECPYGECDGSGIVVVDWQASDSTPCRCRPERQAILRQRRARHPLVAAFIAEIGTLEISDLLEDRTAEAQIRAKWEAFVDRASREIAYRGLDPAGLPALERAAAAPTLSRVSAADGPRQLDPARALGIREAA